MRHFTEFHIHNAKDEIGKPAKVVLVYKQNKAYCLYITEADTLNTNLTYLNKEIDSGCAKDADVLELLESYSIETHPEYFI